MVKVLMIIAQPDLLQDDYARLMTLVSPEKQERINRYRFFRDARNTLIGDVIARTEICKYTGLRNDQLSFLANETGKPFLANYPNIHFNLSHAGDYIAYAMDDAPVGIDVESFNFTGSQTANMETADMEIADWFFSTDEKEYIASQPEALKLNAFFEIWTKKESFIKRNGMGFSMPLTSFSVLSKQAEAVYFHRVFEDKSSICHVCSTKQEIAECSVMTAAEWMENFE